MESDQRRGFTSRRHFLRVAVAAAGATAAGALLQACGAAPAPTATPAPAAAPTKAPAAAPTTAPAAAPTATVAPQAKAGAGGKTTLDLWVWETVEHWQNVVKGSGIAEAIPEANLNYVAMPSDQLHQKYIVGLVSGSPAGMPDIARTSPSFYREMVNTGSLTETTDVMGQYKKDTVPMPWNEITVKGKQYCVADDIVVNLLGYRVDLFEKAGFPTDPEAVAKQFPTWDEYLKAVPDAAKKLGVSLMNFTPDAGMWMNLATQDKTGYFDADGNVIFDSDYHVKAMELTKKMWDSGAISQLGGPQFWDAHKQGKIMTAIWPQYWDFVFLDFAPEAKGKWRVAKMPAVQTGGKRANGIHACNLVVAKFVPPEKRDLAVKVAVYLRNTVKATVSHMNEYKGAFVQYIPGLEAMKGTNSPILDGQKTYDVYLKAMDDEQVLPRYMSSIFYARTNSEFAKNAAFSILTQNAPIAPTLKKAADDVRALQKAEGKM